MTSLLESLLKIDPVLTKMIAKMSSIANRRKCVDDIKFFFDIIKTLPLSQYLSGIPRLLDLLSLELDIIDEDPIHISVLETLIKVFKK